MTVSFVPATFKISSVAVSIPHSAISEVIPFSYLFEASVLICVFWEVLRTLTELKFAASITMFTVFSSASAFLPPFTPAIARGSLPSAIISIVSSSSTSFSSRVEMSSPSLAFRTTILPPSNLSASKT